jgi:hypothetical protein
MHPADENSKIRPQRICEDAKIGIIFSRFSRAEITQLPNWIAMIRDRIMIKEGLQNTLHNRAIVRMDYIV